MEKKKLTAANGRPIADNQNSQTAGQRGPVMLQDPWLIEKRRELTVRLLSPMTLQSTPVLLFSVKSENKQNVLSVSPP